MFSIFDRHHGAQRFFLMIFLCLAVIAGSVLWGGHVERVNNATTIADTALYTTNYVWSRTSEKGKVVGMLTDTNHTKAFLLMHNEGNMSSVNADNYEVFLTGRDEPLTNSPSLTVYSFGVTGYVGLYFTDMRGFANQVYSMIVRDDSEAAKAANENTFADNITDTSFRDHNQIRIYLNFGASGTKTAPVMDGTDLRPLSILADMDVSVTGGESVQVVYNRTSTQCQDLLTTMSDDMRLINQYRDTLTEAGVRVPDLPYYMKGDIVDITPVDFTKKPMEFSSDMLDDSASTSGSSKPVYEDDPEETPEEETEVTGEGQAGATFINKDNVETHYYYLHTDVLYPGSVHFEWQGRRMSEGFISQVYAERFENGTSLDTMYKEYADWRTEQLAEYPSVFPTDITYEAWEMMDGSYLDRDDTTTQGKLLAQTVEDYEAAVTQYLRSKKSYFEQLDKLLALEDEVQAIGNTITSNNGSSLQNLWLY